MFSENRYPPRIKCGAGFFGIMHSCAHASGSGVFIGAALVRLRRVGAGSAIGSGLPVSARGRQIASTICE
jgi:hypothetical protein